MKNSNTLEIQSFYNYPENVYNYFSGIDADYLDNVLVGEYTEPLYPVSDIQKEESAPIFVKTWCLANVHVNTSYVRFEIF